MAQGGVGRGWSRGVTINSWLECWLTHRYREQARSHRGACVHTSQGNAFATGCILAASREEGFDALFNGAWGLASNVAMNQAGYLDHIHDGFVIDRKPAA